MNEHTKRLLQETHAGCKMAISSMNQVEQYVASEKLRGLLKDTIKSHEEVERETNELLLDSGEEKKDPGMMASAFAWATTELKLAFEEKDSKIAEIMMNGCNMGVQSLSKYMNEYTEADHKSVDLARKLIKEEEHFAKILKEFL